MQSKKLAIIILAAGKGKRMNNPDLPKVLVQLKGKPLLGYVLELSEKLNANPIINVIGHHKEKVIDFLNDYTQNSPSVNVIKYCIQTEQLGTGHAVQQVENLLKNFEGDILILSGDVPLLKSKTINKFYELHTSAKSDLSVLSSDAPNPVGYGRIVRNSNGTFEKIIEERDADSEIKKISEINSGIYLVEKDLLFNSLNLIKNENAQKEYYLTDIIEICKKNGKSVNAHNIADFDEIQGVNSQEDLEKLTKKLG